MYILYTACVEHHDIWMMYIHKHIKIHRIYKAMGIWNFQTQVFIWFSVFPRFGGFIFMVIGLSMLGQIFYAKRMNMNLFRMWPLGFLVSNSWGFMERFPGEAVGKNGFVGRTRAN